MKYGRLTHFNLKYFITLVYYNSIFYYLKYTQKRPSPSGHRPFLFKIGENGVGVEFFL